MNTYFHSTDGFTTYYYDDRLRDMARSSDLLGGEYHYHPPRKIAPSVMASRRILPLILPSGLYRFNPVTKSVLYRDWLFTQDGHVASIVDRDYTGLQKFTVSGTLVGDLNVVRTTAGWLVGDDVLSIDSTVSEIFEKISCSHP